MFDPGRLRQRAILQARVRTPDGGGGWDVTWRPVLDGEVDAEILPLSESERIRAQQVGATLTHQVTIRYRPDVTAAMRWLWGERVLVIEGPPRNLGERNEWLQMRCREDA